MRCPAWSGWSRPALFIKLFRRTFGLDDEHLPLFVFMAGSPFFLKNFMHTLGHFDIYGCALAISLLLVAGAFHCVRDRSRPLASMILILIHHIHLLMYVPTIAVIVVLRYYLVQGFNRRMSPSASSLQRASACCSSRRNSSGPMAVPEAEFIALSAEQNGRSVAKRTAEFSYIWYQPLSKEILDTWARMPSNLLGVPVFALLIWLHAPLWKYFAI